MGPSLLALVYLGALVSLCAAQQGYPGVGAFEGFTVVFPATSNAITDIDAREYTNNELIPELGVSKECLVIMDNLAWQVQTNGYNSRCPNGATFGALVVNFSDHSGAVKDSFGRSCGRIVSTNRGPKTKTDVTEHAENDAMRRLAYHNEGQRSNSALWGPLAVFTPGASCPMDTAAEIWAGISWQIYSLSIADLILLNFTQIAMEPEELMTQTRTITKKLGLVRYVNREVNVNRFGYKNILSNPCTPGCHRPTPTSTCVDTTPFTPTPIPDVGYIHVPDDFELIANPIYPADPATDVVG